MAEINEDIIEQFDPDMRAKIARQAELRDLFWEERRAYRTGEYATREQYRAGRERTRTIFNELLVLSEELSRVGFIPPPHRDEPTDAEREAALETLRRLVDDNREPRNQPAAHAAPSPPPEEPRNEDTESEAEKDGTDQNS
ncbi:hypothetical protein CAEBREN_22980 [Caenorhabditis brenneri]|uniref:Uncharacterized protein n=1 Tax=Caenorhabditis brenneri TaxID=135651 RepID=G0MG04_CAEBE|nr:hypothetical protein CAEBREN_22980 [Caenorhabditis brenneri]